jgi:hypothetical protein
VWWYRLLVPALWYILSQYVVVLDPGITLSLFLLAGCAWLDDDEAAFSPSALGI